MDALLAEYLRRGRLRRAGRSRGLLAGPSPGGRCLARAAGSRGRRPADGGAAMGRAGRQSRRHHTGDGGRLTSGRRRGRDRAARRRPRPVAPGRTVRSGAGGVRALRAAGADWAGRHGRGLQGASEKPQPARRREDDPQRATGLAGGLAAVLSRGEIGRQDRPSPRRADSRHRRCQRPALLLHEAGRRVRPGGADSRGRRGPAPRRATAPRRGAEPCRPLTTRTCCTAT